MAKEVQGRWTPVAKPEFNAVLVHASLLPDGQVLYWGRRRNPQAQPAETLDQTFTDAYLWNPPTWVAPVWNATPKKFADIEPTPFSGKSTLTNKGRGWNLTAKTLTDVPNPPLGPMKLNGKDTVNLFCSGHCFLPNGGLLVVGGHIKDSEGLPQACIYDYQTKEFTAQTEMTHGRWYPSALPLPDGRVLAISGTYDPAHLTNNVPQIWSANDPNGWSEVAEPPGTLWPAFPRLHLDPNGRQVFVAGPLADSWFLELKNDDGTEIKKNVPGKTQPILGRWTSAGVARAGPRDYAPSVAYEPGKILYIGGGNDAKDNGAPAKEAQYIDLNVKPLKWTTTSMQFNRRQFNATILPDGTVLVTGGTRIGGFNTLGSTGSTPNPVHDAELWNPDGDKWTTMAAENSDRCYHAIALLLPDGRVLSAGGGEYGGADFGPGKPPQRPGDFGNGNEMDGQIFEPPYLFKSPRPTIKSVQKDDIQYGKEFSVAVASTDSIKKVSLVRLGSVTHCRNMNQSFMWLASFTTPPGATFKVPAPANEGLAPPGHYMLFVLNQDGVPSEASIILLPSKPPAGKPSTMSHRVADIVPQIAKAKQIQPTLLDHNERIIAEQARPPVVIGLTPVCPYGLGGCWAGAHDALQKMTDIDVVRPVPDKNDAVAFVYLQQDILPDIDNWRTEFEQHANKDYHVRGIEMTLSGEVTNQQSSSGEQLTLANTSTRPQVTLAPFKENSQIKWDTTAKAPKPILDAETEAYKKLLATMADHPTGLTVQVTGTLQKLDAKGGFSLDVRHFELPASTSS